MSFCSLFDSNKQVINSTNDLGAIMFSHSWRWYSKQVFWWVLNLFYISCISKSTNRSKYVYSLLVYNESHIPLIQFTKCINGIPSIVDVICKIQNEHRSSGQYTIQFVKSSCKNVNRNDRKKLTKIIKNK